MIRKDVFSKLAAWLANGRRLSQNVCPLEQVNSFLNPMQQISKKEFLLEIFHVDHFGNLILNLHRDDCLKLESIDNPGIRYKELNLTGVHQHRTGIRVVTEPLASDGDRVVEITAHRGGEHGIRVVLLTRPLHLG